MKKVIYQELKATINRLSTFLFHFYRECKYNCDFAVKELNNCATQIAKIYSDIPLTFDGLRNEVYKANQSAVLARNIANAKLNDPNYKWDEDDRELIDFTRKTIIEVAKIVKVIGVLF